MKLSQKIMLWLAGSLWMAATMASSADAQSPPKASLPNRADLTALQNRAFAVRRARGTLSHRLSETTRRRIAGEEEAAFRRSFALAERKFPLSAAGADPLQTARMQDSLWQQSLALLGKKHHLAKGELAAILEEGREKGWASSKSAFP